MTAKEFAEKITAALNLQLDIPLLSEDQEAVLIGFLVHQVAPLIHEDLRPFLLDAADGLSEDEIARHSSVIAAVLNRYVNIPYVPEAAEHAMIRQVVSAILAFAASGSSIDQGGQ